MIGDFDLHNGQRFHGGTDGYFSPFKLTIFSLLELGLLGCPTTIIERFLKSVASLELAKFNFCRWQRLGFLNQSPVKD
jgi:hypothetical protein